MFSSTSYTPLAGSTSHHQVPIKPNTNAASPQRWTFFARWVGFIVCEAAYVSLGVYCLIHPIPLDVSTSRALQAKAFFTVSSIAWQTFCALLINSMVTYIFSAEWHFQLRRTGYIIPRQTDKVSTLTSDIYDQTRHFLSAGSSITFRISFLLSLVILALKGIAPAAVGISTVQLPYAMDVPVANLSAGSDISQINDYVGFSLPLLIRRAAITAHSAQLENTTFKYITEPNRIIPIPSINQSWSGNNFIGPITYPSDYGKFDFTCNWTLPVGSDGLFNVSGKQWKPYEDLFVDFVQNYTTGIIPLTPVTFSGLTEQQSATETSLSLYLFAGRNSTFPLNASLEGLNLDDIPTVETSQILSPLSRISAPLISVLVCDPHLELASGNVTLYPDLSLKVTKTSNATLGIMQQNLTNLMFSLGMRDFVSFSQVSPSEVILNQLTVQWFINDMSAKIFTPNPSFPATSVPFVSPLPLDRITRNINDYFLSASKAFTDGYRYHPDLNGQGLVPIAFYNLGTVEGNVYAPAVAIVTSKIVLYVACAQIGIIALLTPFLYRGWKVGKKYPLSFETLWREKLLKDV